MLGRYSVVSSPFSFAREVVLAIVVFLLSSPALSTCFVKGCEIGEVIQLYTCLSQAVTHQDPWISSPNCISCHGPIFALLHHLGVFSHWYFFCFAPLLFFLSILPARKHPSHFLFHFIPSQASIIFIASQNHSRLILSAQSR